MQPRVALLASLLVLGPALAQDAAPPPQASPKTAQASPKTAQASPKTAQASPTTAARLKDARHRFDLVATHAVANFRSADSIAERLKAEGATLHPQLITLRLQIEASLDETQAALDKGDLDTAKKATDRAEGLLDRFARRLGGD